MRHPFDLNPAELAALDLDFEQQLTDEEASQVGGGWIATTLALGEEFELYGRAYGNRLL